MCPPPKPTKSTCNIETVLATKFNIQYSCASKIKNFKVIVTVNAGTKYIFCAFTLSEFICQSDRLSMNNVKLRSVPCIKATYLFAGLRKLAYKTPDR